MTWRLKSDGHREGTTHMYAAEKKIKNRDDAVRGSIAVLFRDKIAKSTIVRVAKARERQRPPNVNGTPKWLLDCTRRLVHRSAIGRGHSPTGRRQTLAIWDTTREYLRAHLLIKCNSPVFSWRKKRKKNRKRCDCGHWIPRATTQCATTTYGTKQTLICSYY